MTRKQARRRKQQTRQLPRLPVVPIARIVGLVGLLAVLLATFQLSTNMLDRPIRSLEINGPFQRVTALQIEEAINDELDYGFLTADLDRIQEKVVDLPWIDHANVARRWPSKIVITVTEQVPAACWGESGLLNTRGELFVTDASHIPAELPRLSGPESQASEVARRYLEIREQLIPLGLDVRKLEVDARGSWDMSLQNGVEIRLGKRDVAERTRLFLDVVANVVSSREAAIDFVDMRCSNGFTIGWKDGVKAPLADPRVPGKEMVAGRILQ
jgi:cell division protein FtsQ